MKDLCIKIITGFREDQQHTIPMNEAHKAYRLFSNPNERAIFSNGLAVLGSSIKEIQPDYQATMGWNATHQLGNDDWNELRMKKIDVRLRDAMAYAKEIAYNRPDLLSLPLEKSIEIAGLLSPTK